MTTYWFDMSSILIKNEINIQRNGVDKRMPQHMIPSLDISQYSDSGSYIVTELESEPLRRGISKFMDGEKPPRMRVNGTTASAGPSCSTPSSSDNLSSKITSNGFFGSQSPTKSCDGSLMNEVQIREAFFFILKVFLSSLCFSHVDETKTSYCFGGCT